MCVSNRKLCVRLNLQVKFLSQEEEEARVDFSKKEAVFTEEIARLQASLKAERAAVVEARKDNGNEGKRGLEGYLKWVNRRLVLRFEVAEIGVGCEERYSALPSVMVNINHIPIFAFSSRAGTK